MARKKSAPCTQPARRDFDFSDSVDAAYLKRRNKEMRVFCNSSCCTVAKVVAQRKLLTIK